MARKYHTHVTEKKAWEYAISIPDLEEYKNAWLILHNHVREYPETFYKVSNNSLIDIYVMVAHNISNSINIESFLGQFGEITRKDERYAIFVDVECDYQDFDKDYIDGEYIFGETI